MARRGAPLAGGLILGVLSLTMEFAGITVLPGAGRAVAGPPVRVSQDAAHARPGFWRPPDVDSRHAAGWGLDAAQTKVIHDKLQRIAEVIREAPVLKSPVGFEVRAFQGIALADGEQGKKPSGRKPPRSALFIKLYDYVQTCPTCPIEPVVETGAWITVTVNTIGGFYDLPQKPFAKDAAGPMYLAPRQVGELRGFPLFQANPAKAPRFVVAGDATRPIWLPVSQERYIRSEIALWEGVAAAAKPPQDQISRRKIAELTAELEDLTAAERAAPATLAKDRATRPSGLGPSGAQGARAIVSTNPAFFDPSRPATDFQLVVVETYRPDILVFKPGYFIGQKLLEAMKTVDWEKIAASIK